MPTTTMSSREFNQDTSRAKKAAQNGPVVITDGGRPAHVLKRTADAAREPENRPHDTDGNAARSAPRSRP